jgi:hypothetical protein
MDVCTSFATNIKVKTKFLVLRIKILAGKNDRLSIDSVGILSKNVLTDYGMRDVQTWPKAWTQVAYRDYVNSTKSCGNTVGGSKI